MGVCGHRLAGGDPKFCNLGSGHPGSHGYDEAVICSKPILASGWSCARWLGHEGDCSEKDSDRGPENPTAAEIMEAAGLGPPEPERRPFTIAPDFSMLEIGYIWGVTACQSDGVSLSIVKKCREAYREQRTQENAAALAREMAKSDPYESIAQARERLETAQETAKRLRVLEEKD